MVNVYQYVEEARQFYHEELVDDLMFEVESVVSKYICGMEKEGHECQWVGDELLLITSKDYNHQEEDFEGEALASELDTILDDLYSEMSEEWDSLDEEDEE